MNSKVKIMIPKAACIVDKAAIVDVQVPSFQTMKTKAIKVKEHYSLAPETFVRSKSTILFSSLNFSIEYFITIVGSIQEYHFHLKDKEYSTKIIL